MGQRIAEAAPWLTLHTGFLAEPMHTKASPAGQSTLVSSRLPAPLQKGYTVYTWHTGALPPGRRRMHPQSPVCMDSVCCDSVGPQIHSAEGVQQTPQRGMFAGPEHHSECQNPLIQCTAGIQQRVLQLPLNAQTLAESAPSTQRKQPPPSSPAELGVLQEVQGKRPPAANILASTPSERRLRESSSS